MSDHHLSGADAMQAAARKAGDLLVWTICWNPKDAPWKFTARPHSTRAGAPCDFVVVASTLDAVRAFLPRDLTRFLPGPGDDPVIVESWI
jgi:hypothetical protein